MKPCVGGYTVKRPRFEPEQVDQVAPDKERGSTYFPTGDNRRPSTDEVTTTDISTTNVNDPRHPKEVTTDNDDFDIPEVIFFYSSQGSLRGPCYVALGWVLTHGMLTLGLIDGPWLFGLPFPIVGFICSFSS